MTLSWVVLIKELLLEWRHFGKYNVLVIWAIVTHTWQLRHVSREELSVCLVIKSNVSRPFSRFLTPYSSGVNRAKIAANVIKKVKRFNTHKLRLIDFVNEDFSVMPCRQMYGKIKTLIVVFLVRLFLSNTISKFSYLVSFVFYS